MTDSHDFPQELLTCDSPFLIGVRHHSAAITAVIPELLEAANPEVIFLEAPGEFAGWFKFLQDEATTPPIALVTAKERDYSFYPFAEFSPEWATIRWAGQNDVPIVPIDITTQLPGSDGSKVFDNVDLGQVWDRSVEAHAEGSTAEQVRSAALRIGWALRSTSERSERDLARETWMRKIIAEHPGRAAAVIGSFHAAALLPTSLRFEPVEIQSDADQRTVSIVRYNHALLDGRSGYPAGVLDPAWHRAVLHALQSGTPIEKIIDEFAVLVCREVRDAGQGGASVDAIELSRLTKGLARLRSLPTPGRAEFVEAAQTVLTQASEGRARSIARSLETVLVGTHRGTLSKDVPRCGLAASTDQLFEKLNLPTDGEKEFKLDPSRSKLDRHRHLTFRRMEVCDIRYATFEESTFVAGLPSIQQKWTVNHGPSTEASIELAGLYGVHLEAAASGALRYRFSRLDEDELSHEVRFQYFAEACEAGLTEISTEWFGMWQSVWETEASLTLLIKIDRFLGQLGAGQVFGMTSGDDTFEFVTEHTIDTAGAQRRILVSVHRLLEGILKSEDHADAVALTEIVYRDREERPDGEPSLLDDILRRMLEEGSDLMKGAAAALLVVTEAVSFDELPILISSWIDGAGTPELRERLGHRLEGMLSASRLLIESRPELALAFDERIGALKDSEFLSRLPALRRGFNILADNDRKRLMRALEDRFPAGDIDTVTISPEVMSAFANADRIAREKMGAPEDDTAEVYEANTTTELGTRPSHSSDEISQPDRWRLILGQPRGQMSNKASRVSFALEQLYGTGGARTGFGGGQEDSFPTTREWAEELENLFGERVREEVLADAAPTLPAAALELDPDFVRPSVDLLQTILPLAGSMSESQLTKLRPLIERCVQEITRMLAMRMKPALFGSMSPRPTRRRSPKLDMPRTIRKNLGRVRINDDGTPEVFPETLIYRSPQKKSMAWDLYLVVDVSGSMEPSIIYSAIVAAILTGVPWVNLNFFVFNTDVADLTEHAADPLALLLEVNIGGGTNIGRALHYTAEQIRVPRRSIVMVLSDFEEGFSLNRLISEARHLVESGVKVLGLASLDHDGKGRYDASTAKALVRIGMPVAALSPLELAQWIKEQVE